MNLTPHFTLEELTASETAARKGIDNSPNVEVLANLQRLAGLLEQIRDRLGRTIRVSSGYRSPELNKAIGGSTHSAHMDGLAADITAPGMTNPALAKAIAEMSLPLDQIILEFPERGGWVHVGLSKESPRGQLLTASSEGGKTVYKVGLLA